jgi:hypothetical protein
MFRRLLPVLKTVVPALSCGLAAEKSLAKCEDGVPAVFPTRLQNQAGKLVDSREALAGKHVLLYFRCALTHLLIFDLSCFQQFFNH